jgi:tetratricopeptide (TPR) repeat protein
MRRPITLASAVLLIATYAWGQAVDEQARREALRHARAGQELLYSEGWEKAAEEFQQAVKLDPMLTLAHYGLGQAYMGMKDYPKAIDAYTACREAYRQQFALAKSDAKTVERQRDQEISELRDSIREIQAGRIKTDAHAVLRLEERVRDLQRTKQRDDAVFEPPSAVSLALGSAYFRSGRLEDAEREYLAAVKTSPKFGEAWNNLAVVYMMTDRIKEADDAVKSAERAGFHVNPGLKADIKSKKAS